MRLPEIPITNDRVTMLSQFSGLNRNNTINESEFSNMLNITNDFFPAIAPRRKRAFLATLHRPLAFIGGQNLSYVDEIIDDDGTVHDLLFINERFVMDLLEEDDRYKSQERTLVRIGALVFVYPEGIIYNTNDGTIETVQNKKTVNAEFTISTYAGSDITIKFKADERPTNPQDGDYWYDTSKKPEVLKVWTASTSTWNSIGTSYVKVSGTGIAEGFNDYDAADFSDIDAQGKTFNDYDFNQTNIIFKAHHDEDDPNNDYLLIAGYINEQFSSTVTVERKLPKMDYIVEQSNRLWGCSSENHEIYACKLGDPKNWYCYAGLDNDSYAVTTGSEGDFTGAASYSGTVFFFKEDGLYRIWGSRPSNYEVQWKPCKGVQYGSSKSVVVVGDLLMYKGREGVCIYDGSTRVVSENLGPEAMFDAVAGAYNDKYYVSMRDKDYKYSMYVYDTRKGMWAKEDENRFWYMATARSGFHMIDSKFNVYVTSTEAMKTKVFPNQIRNNFPEKGESDKYYPIDPNGEYGEFAYFAGNSIELEEEPNFDWMIETKDMGPETPYHQYLKRIVLRMQLDYDTRFIIEVAYDRSNAFHRVMEYTCTRQKAVSLPIRVRRCDSFRLRIKGNGDFKLFSLAKIVEEGSDV